MYAINDAQLPRLWAVIEYFSVLREITDEEDRRKMLTQAQILLTGFIFGLQPLPEDRGNRGTIEFRSRDAIGFGA